MKKKKRVNIFLLVLCIFIISAAAAFIRNADLSVLKKGSGKIADRDNNTEAVSQTPEKALIPENGNTNTAGSLEQSKPDDNKNNSKTTETAENLDDILILVNKDHSLKPDYVPKGLVKLDVPIAAAGTSEERMMRKEAAEALKKMFSDAKKAGYKFGTVSGYRSFKSQKDTYDQNLKAKGKAYVDKYVAAPGQSEHQSGLAMDVGVVSDKPMDFGQTRESVWLKNNCQNYGFIIRYLSGKERITGYNYEPWHVRYIGVKAAKEIKKDNQVLEEYLKES